MKLVHSKYEFQIDFNEGSITVLFFDDSVLFRSFVAELISQCDSGEDGDFILSNDGQECPLSENINIIPNPLYISFDRAFFKTQVFNEKLHEYAECVTLRSQY